ncbi:RNA polymerase subunit sigma [Rhodococcus sp. 14C212]|uniref:sigma factor n=1 Tax=Rhodococcus sp. 14C212 TaxID=2711209 RepID=UPI0013EC4284|nr:RNA polymerase subunit sigma [Rhodococcus sp. 14C212]
MTVTTGSPPPPKRAPAAGTERSGPAADDRLRPLLARVAGKDRAAFAALYDLTVAQVHGIVLRVVRGDADAEDVTREVFEQVWHTADRYAPQVGSPMAWLSALAHRWAADRIRSRAGGPHAGGPAEAEPLGCGHGEPLHLAYYEGMTCEQIAERLGLPVATVRARIRAGVARIRATDTGAPAG